MKTNRFPLKIVDQIHTSPLKRNHWSESIEVLHWYEQRMTQNRSRGQNFGSWKMWGCVESYFCHREKEIWSRQCKTEKERDLPAQLPNVQEFYPLPGSDGEKGLKRLRETASQILLHLGQVSNPPFLPPSSAKDWQLTIFFLEKVKLRAMGLVEATCIWGEGTLVNTGKIQGKCLHWILRLPRPLHRPPTWVSVHRRLAAKLITSRHKTRRLFTQTHTTLYYFPRAAVTNYHTAGGLKQ